MIYLHKLLPIALSPIGLILGLMLWAAFKRSRAAALLAIVLIYGLSMPLLSDRIFRTLEQHQLPLAVARHPACPQCPVLGHWRNSVR